MLPFNNRLVKKKDHERVQKLGNFISAENIALKVLENDLKETRVGIVVGLKYSKKAVERNQVKRKLREIFRAEIRNIKKGFDIVVMARKREEEKTKNLKLEANIKEALQKGQLITNTKEAKSSTNIK